MKHLAHASIARLCRKRLERFIRQSSDVQLPLAFERALTELTQIAWHNFSSGRYERLRRYRRTGQTLTSVQYVDLLIKHWCVEGERLRRLADHDDAEWTRLYGALAQRADRVLMRYRPNSAVNEAADLAQRTCEQIYDSFYPCDVPFDAWTGVILKNLARAPTRSKDALDKPHDSVDTTDPAPPLDGERSNPAAHLVSDRASREFDQVENRELLERALRKLSPLRRQVLELTYFEDWSDLRIARYLGKTVGAVQTIRHRALSQLRELLAVRE